MDNSRIVVPTRRDATDDIPANRSHHIISIPRSTGVFPGWGVRF